MTDFAEYKHSREGDIIKVEITDFTRRTLYKQKFNIKDKNAIYNLLKALEKFSGISVPALIQSKLELGEWF